MSQQPDGLTRIYQNGLLLIGITLVVLSINELRTLWTSKTNLIPLTGTLRTADIYTSTVQDRKGHKSQRVELIFYLNEYDKKFSLTENLAQDYYSTEYRDLVFRLNRGKIIKVWIKESEKEEHEPKVFQIDSDEVTILDFEKVKSKNRWLTAFMLLIGLGSIVLFTWFRYPEKLKKVFE